MPKASNGFTMLDDIDRIRRFNRFYIQKLGLFSSDFLGTGENLTELRVLYDIGYEPDLTARDLSRLHELDEGYLSRVLKGFERKGWLAREPSERDARVKVLRLTQHGKATLNRLVQKSKAEVARRLEGHDPGQVADAMGPLQYQLGGINPESIEIRDLAPGDMGWIVQRNAEFYADTAGFGTELESVLCRICADFLAAHDPRRERVFIAADGATRLGSIFCIATDDPKVAKLRIFFVEPCAQGLGLGRKLIEACLAFARSVGYERMTLMTVESQVTARALYRRYGFEIVQSERLFQYGKEVVEEIWETDLRSTETVN